MGIRSFFLCILWLVAYGVCQAQSLEETYRNFKQQAYSDYTSFREECNQKYVEFLRNSWSWYEGKAPLPVPEEESPVPPRPYNGENGLPDIDTKPVEITSIDNNPQPKPIEPIREIPNPNQDYFTLCFYGQKCCIRLPEFANLSLQDCHPNSIAAGWEKLCNDDMNNAIRDCLETRLRYNLCDWAYLMFLNQLAQQYCNNHNGATLLTAFLYCQSGYQMRLAVDESKLILLYGSRHQIFDKGYFNVNGSSFYPLGELSNSISICGAAFEGETPMSLIIDKEQLLAQKTKDKLYPSLRKYIAERNKLQAAEMLLNWVQTGFVYEYDDKVWGHDRAFFAEETLYYPYADCEDRSILFSRLIRDLLDLDVALIYYPGHLATAVCFDQEVSGDAMIIGVRKFIVCDPTYIGAPVGAQMPVLEYDKAQAIVLNK